MPKKQPRNVKFCWVATETKKGWRLKLAVGSKDYNLSGLLLADPGHVERITQTGSVVFARLSDNKG